MAAYAVFLVTFLYAIGFTGELVVPKTIDVGVPAGAVGEPLFVSLVVNLVLLAVFALQHSVMARPAFKRWWTRFVPPSCERSTYVLLASGALILLFAQWRPLPDVVWDASGSPFGTLLAAMFWAGWALVLGSTFLIDHFELFGLRQVWARLMRRPLPQPVFRTPFAYRHVRHPIYLGFLLAFWGAPVMTVGHLVFALATTGYILIGIRLEERDLIAQFGDRYRAYRVRVRMLLPRFGVRFDRGAADGLDASDAPKAPSARGSRSVGR